MGSKAVTFYVKSFPKMRVIGKTVPTKTETTLDDTTIQDLIKSMQDDGSLNFLQTLPNRISQAADTVGWMGDWQPGADTYTYLYGVLFQADAPVPEDFTYRDIEAGEMAVAWIQGDDSEEGGDMMANASMHTNNAAKAHGYEYDGSGGLFEMEYYSEERFHGPLKRGEPVLLDFYSPCKKASQTG